MQKNLSGRLQGILACVLGLVMMILISACAGTGSTSGTTTTTTTTGTQQTTAATATQAPAATATQTSSTTQQPTTFKAGGISFIGPVKNVNSSSITMSAPDGQSYTMKISSLTDLTGFNGSLPGVGVSVDMDSAANTDGSFTATILKPAQAGDPDLKVIAYTGITTSAVGPDRVIHFTSGTASYAFPIPANASLSDFGNNAQAIVANTSVKVKIQFNGSTKTLVSVGNNNGG